MNNMENKCPKCKLAEMTPKFEPEGVQRPWRRAIENVTKFMLNDDYYYQDTVKKEHIIWICPICNYKIAKAI